ncbi:cell wall-binding repeat-containing protein [Marisediminicola senii]|uniref:cell wall-binding repeat-containing protein n=1 Tax=Marisediminicola senii TaxID=2711233 RepID=UPI0013EBA920|nr:cell wall-binding repeat-containing protein [Marisediminicola senii]
MAAVTTGAAGAGGGSGVEPVAAVGVGRRRRGWSARVAIVAALAMAFTSLGATGANAASQHDEVAASTNAERAAVGLAPLQRDVTMDAAAQEWANVMSSQQRMFHSTNQWRQDRIPAGWDTHGENVAYGFSSASGVMNGWMNSQGHKDNILQSRYTRIGVGYVASGNYWVQIFAGYPNDRKPQLTAAPTPSVAGTATEGQRLTVNAGSWAPSPVTLAYQWRANGVPISGATGGSYTLTALDVGAAITVTVTGSRSGYNSAVRTSAATAAVKTRLSVSRISGSDRYAVANAISQRAFPGGADTVYLVTGAKYPDALSAAPAAISQDAPLLLTAPGELVPSVRDEIRRLGPDTVVVVGGPASVSDAVMASLREIAPTVRRIDGPDRFSASRAIADYAFGDGAASAYVSTGTNFPDALSAGSPAGATNSPVILVNGGAGSADGDTRGALDELGVSSVRIAGGPASVSSGIERSLQASGRTVTRLQGADRFAASIAINADARATGTYPRGSTVYLATGMNFPDALAGSALAGRNSAPLFVIPPSCVPRGVLAEIAALGSTNVVLLGGPVSLSEQVAAMVPCGP